MLDRQTLDPSHIARNESDYTILSRISRAIPGLLCGRVPLPIDRHRTLSLLKNTGVKLTRRGSEPLQRNAHKDPIRIRYAFNPLLNYFVF